MTNKRVKSKTFVTNNKFTNNIIYFSDVNGLNRTSSSQDGSCKMATHSCRFTMSCNLSFTYRSMIAMELLQVTNSQENGGK